MNSPHYKKKISLSGPFNRISRMLRTSGARTICREGRCPNISECFSRKKLTFLILGDTCTRSCTFCNVKKGEPSLVKGEEASRIIPLIKRLDLKHIILTSVTRDDLPDGGTSVYLDTMSRIRQAFPAISMEILIPDLNGDGEQVRRMALSEARVIGHNIETVRRLYPLVRKGADYDRSLSLLRTLKRTSPGKTVKSGFMVGLGETGEEINELLTHLWQHRTDAITIGQYFQPSLKSHAVRKYYSDEEFRDLEKTARTMGFRHVAAGRFVRSSYHAEDIFQDL